MSNLYGSRVNVYMSKDTHARSIERVATLGVTLAEIIAAVLAVVPDKELLDIIARAREVKTLEKTVEQALTGKMLELVKGKSVEDLKSILAAAQGAVKPK